MIMGAFGVATDLWRAHYAFLDACLRAVSTHDMAHGPLLTVGRSGRRCRQG